MAASLKIPSDFTKAEFQIQRGAACLRVDDTDIPLSRGRGFAQTIVKETLHGMIRSLKGVDPDGEIRLVLHRDD